MEQDALESALLPSHGRGRWFEPSIAHSGRASFCRQTAKLRVSRRTGFAPFNDSWEPYGGACTLRYPPPRP